MKARRPVGRKARKNPARSASRAPVRGTREIGQRMLPWATTGSSIARVARAFDRGEAAPRAEVRSALYAVRTLRTRYTDDDLRAIERALAARVETPRENPLRPPARRRVAPPSPVRVPEAFVIVPTGEVRRQLAVHDLYAVASSADAEALARHLRGLGATGARVILERPRESAYALVGVVVRERPVTAALREAAMIRPNPKPRSRVARRARSTTRRRAKR